MQAAHQKWAVSARSLSTCNCKPLCLYCLYCDAISVGIELVVLARAFSRSACPVPIPLRYRNVQQWFVVGRLSMSGTRPCNEDNSYWCRKLYHCDSHGISTLLDPKSQKRKPLSTQRQPHPSSLALISSICCHAKQMHVPSVLIFIC